MKKLLMGLFGIAIATTCWAVPTAQTGSFLTAPAVASENFDSIPADQSFNSPVTFGGFVFRSTTNTAFYLFPGTGVVGFSTTSLYAGGINGMVTIKFADGSAFDQLTFALGNGTGSVDPNDYIWIRTYLNGAPTGHDFDFIAPRGSAYTVSGGGFDEVRVQTYHTHAALLAHSESTLGAVSIDNVAATSAVQAAIDILPRNERNAINLRSEGIVQVALFGSTTLTVANVDWSSLRFGATGTEAPLEGLIMEDVNRDGLTDAVIRFRTSETGISCSTTSASLKGRLTSGSSFAGSDQFRVTGC